MHQPLTRLSGLAAGWLVAAATAGADPGPSETWRLTEARPAPWAAAATTATPAAGGLWRLQGGRLQISGLPSCAALRQRYVLQPAEGLFEGLLPAPADDAARALGVQRLPLLTQRIRCDNASFDLHHVAPGRALTALDGRVLSLRRDATDGSPQAVAAALLQQHFGDDMAFTPASVEAEATWLGAALRRRIAAWWALPTAPDEVPAINGDPFTNSQEYPDAFELGSATVRGTRARLPVHFSGEGRAWTVTLLLEREQGQWRVTDLRYADGTRLSEWLRPPAPRPVRLPGRPAAPLTAVPR